MSSVKPPQFAAKIVESQNVHPIARNLTYSIGFALLTAVAAQLMVPFWPVPLTFQTVTVLAAGVVLGPAWGFTSMSLYLILGAVGLPAFAGLSHGPHVFIGVTAGYLASYPVASLIASRATAKSFWVRLAWLVIADAFILTLGAIWLGHEMGARIALLSGVVPFLFGDVLKAGLVAMIPSRKTTAV